MLTRSFKIGMNAGHIVTPVIHVNQYDHDEQWIFTLVDDNGVVYTPSTGGIVGLKADGNVILNAGTVNSSGQVVINETQQMTAAAGDATYELLLDNSTHGCANFTVRVEPKPGDNATLSDSDLSLLQEAIDSTIPANIEAAVQDWMDDNLAPSQWVIDNTLSIAGAAADAKKTGDGLAELKTAINTLSYVDDCPWIKELYINEAGQNADVAKLNNVVISNGKYCVRFANTAGNAFVSVSKWYEITDKTYGIIPLYNVANSSYEAGNTVYGYIIADFANFTASTAITKPLNAIAYVADYSPQIKDYLSALTLDDIKTRNIGSTNKTSIDFDDCVTQVANATPLYTNGFEAPSDSVLLGVEVLSITTKVDVYVSEGKYAESKKWRCYALNVPVVQSKAVESDTPNCCAFVSSYNLEMKKGDEVYIRFVAGYWRYSANTENDYNALANISATSGMTVKYQVSFNLVYAELTDAYDDTSEILHLTMCVIGDSLTQGVDIYKHVIAESYPFWMSRFLGSKVLNYGQMGRTAQTWWNNYRTYYSYDSEIDVVLIMFGTNGGLTQNTLATDVEPYNNWEDYADTNCGDYCKLIEYIMEQTQNHAQIFLLTPPYSSYNTTQTNTVILSEATIRAIAKRYNLPVIDVLNESGMGKFNADVFRPNDGCHFNAKGYHRLGTFIGSRVKAYLSQFELTDNFDDEYTAS